MKMHIIRSPEGVWSEPIDYFEDISVQFIFQAQHIPKKKNMLFFSRKPVVIVVFSTKVSDKSVGLFLCISLVR